MKQRLWVLVVTGALVASACSTGGTATITDDTVGSTDTAATAEPAATLEPTASAVAQVEPTAPPAPTAEPTPAATATPVPPTPTPESAPPISSALSRLQAGDCFDNVGTADGGDVPGAPIDCNQGHEYEVFFVGQTSDGPDVPYRFDADFTDGLFQDFCDPATIEFAGAPWDALPFGVTVWTPSAADWEAGDRSFVCTAEAGLRNENIYKVGTAAGGNLVSDEGIVARATLGGQRDLFFSFQGSTLYPLTDGSFELPNLSPHVTRTGFLFASPLQDVEGRTSIAYDFNFETLDTTRLQTGRDGWEVASPHFVVDIPAFVFAARETESDDWDIFLSRSADDVVALADGPSDDQWLSLTPDESQIVYSSGGDIWIMNVDGSGQQQLTTDATNDFESAVSPDGTQIVFASDRSGNDDIWIMNIDGTDQRNLTNHPGNEAWPFFSEDGSLIYFQTDRLGVRSNIMMMQTDGSNQSYFSFEFMTNGAILPSEVSELFASELPTIAEVLETTVEGVVEGAEGDFTDVAHSSGRLVASLPAGWEFQEITTDDPATLLAATSTAAFNSTWAADGVLITVIESGSLDDLVARLDAATAATDSSCVEDDRSTETDETRTVIERNYSCGERSSAVVVGIYPNDADIGLLFEGQWDDEPDAELDRDTIEQIARALRWG